MWTGKTLQHTTPLVATSGRPRGAETSPQRRYPHQAHEETLVQPPHRHPRHDTPTRRSGRAPDGRLRRQPRAGHRGVSPSVQPRPHDRRPARRRTREHDLLAARNFRRRGHVLPESEAELVLPLTGARARPSLLRPARQAVHGRDGERHRAGCQIRSGQVETNVVVRLRKNTCCCGQCLTITTKEHHDIYDRTGINFLTIKKMTQTLGFIYDKKQKYKQSCSMFINAMCHIDKYI